MWVGLIQPVKPLLEHRLTSPEQEEFCQQVPCRLQLQLGFLAASPGFWPILQWQSHGPIPKNKRLILQHPIALICQESQGLIDTWTSGWESWRRRGKASFWPAPAMCWARGEEMGTKGQKKIQRKFYYLSCFLLSFHLVMEHAEFSNKP